MADFFDDGVPVAELFSRVVFKAFPDGGFFRGGVGEGSARNFGKGRTALFTVVGVAGSLISVGRLRL